MIYYISVDVHAHWNESPPIYRLYMDNDMLVERTFAWTSHQNYVRENVVCELHDGVHTLKLVNCTPDAGFELKKVRVRSDNADMTPAQMSKHLYLKKEVVAGPKIYDWAHVQRQQQIMKLELAQLDQEQALT